MAKIKRFGVLKMAGFLGIYSAFFGLIFAIIVWLLSLLFTNTDTLPSFPISLFSFSLIYLIILPIIYGVIGFVS